MEPATFIVEDHARLGNRIAPIATEASGHRRAALIARYVIDYEIHMRIFEEARGLTAELGQACSPSDVSDDDAEHVSAEESWLASLDRLPAARRDALGTLMANRRRQLEEELDARQMNARVRNRAGSSFNDAPH